MYNPSSKEASEFINHEEIERSLQFANKKKDDKEYLLKILEKAETLQGLTHEEVAVLIACEDEEILSKIEALAIKIKEKLYGNRIVMFAPLYLSNYCVNGCVYCPYHYQNKEIPRVKLTQEEVKAEVIALQDMGHKRLAIEVGEDPINCPIDYVLECIETIYSVQHKNGSIRRVNVNVAATTVENYRKLRDAGIGTYILFQETYHQQRYEALHPTGPKHNYAYHTEAMDRAMEAGIDDVGVGVLFGLENYAYELVGLMMHKEHLEAIFGVGPHTVSVPRIQPASDIDPNEFKDALSDELFERIVSIIRIAVPYTGIIVSTRESQAVRERSLKLGVSQLSGASSTSIKGYTNPEEVESAQFDLSDTRTLDEIVEWLLSLGYMPSFCTACYREGRTGDRFMSLVKSGQIANICGSNALLTLKEYLDDYASEETKRLGERVIAESLERIPNEKVKKKASEYLHQIDDGKRDFRF